MPADASSPLVPPLSPSAVYVFPDLDALDAVYEGAAAGYVYARDGHPNARDLADRLTALEGGRWGVVCGTGMAALTAAFVPLLAAGSTVVASDRLYGKTTRLLKGELSRFGVATVFVDVTDLNAVRAAVETHRPRVLFAETLSNPLCRAADVPALAEIAHAADCRLVVDNTFATPALCRPLDLGADVVMESLTKLVGGHSDVTLGFVGGTDAAHGETVAAAVSAWGLSAPPFDCWLTLRGLETLPLRARAATDNAASLADWLAGRPGVARVAYPGLASHPDHAVVKRLMPTGAANMMCFELAGGRDAVNRFLRAAPGIPFAPSLGHTSTTVSYPWGTSHRFDPPADKLREGITEGLVRVSVGCEPFEQLAAEMAKGLAAAAS